MTLQAPTTFSTPAPEVEMVATHQLSGGESIITTLVIIRPSEPICPPGPSKQAALPIWCSSALSTIDKVLDRRSLNKGYSFESMRAQAFDGVLDSETPGTR
ncbi:uncharacterized protein BO87DRAFT_425074 [Aspergillus neoniger CBS 115656]|uniref:Uncharacterized protein n=1 Tax=Aspergillus neoniger (strain CBS 115656) TaxID=1448310 RepID=A0A318Z475_ASPNB|nr:hypothetical protein BO87DRAFT_425074 [Aspergillus neoniger CBS 115656]PYH34988.1 hypothetical protein BO87DRAFT_425074 [Aspergillus neoniger CBS 115656]